MLNKIRVKDVGAYVGKEITLKGWLYNKRSSGKLHFLQLRCWPWEAQSSPRVARESWGLRSSHRRAEETSPRRVSAQLSQQEEVPVISDTDAATLPQWR